MERRQVGIRIVQKNAGGRGGADDVHIDLDTGDVIARESGDVIGNLHDG